MKKIILGLLVFVAGIFLTCNFIKVKAAATVTLTEGASIRTDEKAGMRFQATVSEAVEGASYGMVFARGEVADLTVESTGAVTAEVTELKDDLSYAVSMVNFPVYSYHQDITVRAYIKDAEGNYTYSESSVTRNLYELASAAGVEGEFVQKVLTATKFDLGAGNFEYDHEFKITRYDSGAGTGYYVTVAPKATQGNGSGLYWAKIYLAKTNFANVYDVVAVTESGVKSPTDIAYDYVIAAHEACYDIVSFNTVLNIVGSENPTDYYVALAMPSTTTCDVAVKVSTDPNKLLGSVLLVEEGGSLPAASLANYTFNGWYDNAEYTGEAVTVQGSARTLYAKYTPVQYSISYNLNDGTCAATLVESYNVESSEIVLPTAEQMTITNGVFAGWYDNAEFAGDAITTIDTSNGGNISLYAKWQMLCSTDVTFEMNGGERVADYEFAITEYKTTAWNFDTNLSTQTSLITKNAGRVFLKYNETLGLYESLSAVAAGSSYPSTLPEGWTHILGAYPSKGTDSTKAILEMVDLVLAGEKVYFDFGTLPSSSSKTWEGQACAYTSIDLLDSNFISYNEDADELPKLQKAGYTFVGWFNSNDQQVTNIEIGTEDVELTLTAKFETITYTISYELSGGNCSVELPTSYNIETETIVLPTAAQMTLEGAEFVGWTNANGDTVTEIAKGSIGNVELTANWVLEEADQLEISDADAAVLNKVYTDKAATATILVNSSITSAAKYVLSNANLGAEYAEVEYIYGSNLFSSVADALAVAKENEVIYVFAGTYADALTISVANVTLAGPNYGVKGNGTRNAEANVTGLTDIAAAGATVNGFNFTGSANVKLSASNVTIASSRIAPSSTIGSAGSNRKAVLVSGVSTKLSGVSILDNYLDTPGTGFSISNESIVLDNAENCVISGNYITNSQTNAAGSNYPGSAAMLRFYTVSGTLNIYNNEFAWGTYGYAIEIANTANSCTEINIKENVFDNNGLYATNAGINIRKGSSSCVTNVIGNKFYNVTGSTILATGDTGSTINVKYNLFGEGTSYKTGGIGSATLVFSNNYYAAAQTTSTSDYDTYTHDADGLAAYEAAYAAYKAQ